MVARRLNRNNSCYIQPWYKEYMRFQVLKNLDLVEQSGADVVIIIVEGRFHRRLVGLNEPVVRRKLLHSPSQIISAWGMKQTRPNRFFAAYSTRTPTGPQQNL